jgi:hypothetical protein
MNPRGKTSAALIALVTMAGSAQAAPFVIGDYDAAETVEIKLDTEFRDKTGEQLRAFPKWDLTVPIVSHLEMSFGGSYRRRASPSPPSPRSRCRPAARARGWATGMSA